jgi:hypothetical protein
MDQHPIPQHISSYRFRLIGEMTLEQFGKVAAGCIIALVFYALPLPALIKWLFIILSASAGALSAFVPFEGRPLETWIISFIKSIYSPTEYIWKKSPVDFSFAKTQKETSSQEALPQKSSSRSLSVRELALLQALSWDKSLYTPEELKQAQKMLGLFQQTAVSGRDLSYHPAPQSTKPQKEVRFKEDLPFPSTPNQPNVLVGMVIDRNSKITEGAIVEIKDKNSDTVRAMRTNKLGQFRTVSPLPDGQYQISTEKPGLNFDIMKIKLAGEIIPPIEIRENGN